MTDQTDLFRPDAQARRTDPMTSRAAALNVKVNHFEALALHGLAELGGEATIKEVVDLMGTYESISPRFRPLVRKGLIQDSRRRKQNIGGRMAIVWKMTIAGWNAHLSYQAEARAKAAAAR